MVVTGSKGYAKYSPDDGTTWYEFGDGLIVNSVRMRNEIIRVTGVGCRRPEILANGRFEASWGLGFVLTNSSDTTLDKLVTNLGILDIDPKKLSLDIVADGLEFRSDNVYVSRMSLSSRVGEVVRVGVDGIADMFVVGSPSASLSCGSIGVPVTFETSYVKIDGSDVGGYVRGFDVTINSAIEGIYALGDRKIVDAYGRLMSFTGRMTVVLNGITLYQKFLAGDDVEIELGFSSSDKIILNPSRIEEISVSIRPGEVVEADVSFIGANIGVV